MNYIISSYLTTAIDTQRNIIKTKDDPDYISAWYDSIIRLKLNAILLHDELSEYFIKQFPGIEFRKIPPVPPDIQLYDYRWLLHLNCMENIEMENVFFIDVSDVQIIMNPFIQSEFNDHSLYCGDQSYPMKEWVNHDSVLQSKKLILLPDFHNIIDSDKMQLNCGIFGGNRKIVFNFLKILCRHIRETFDRPLDGSVDMVLFIYVMYKYFSTRLIHGFPVHSIYRKFEKRNDVWFIHK